MSASSPNPVPVVPPPAPAAQGESATNEPPLPWAPDSSEAAPSTDESSTGSRWKLSNLSAPWAVSLVVHAWLLLALALILLGDSYSSTGLTTLRARQAEPAAAPVRLQTESFDTAAAGGLTAHVVASDAAAVEVALVGNQAAPHGDSVGLDALVRDDWLTPASGLLTGLDGRRAANRAQLVLSRGGTAESELAVERGLAWLAAHQLDDGSWRLNHHLAPQCRGLCRHPGNIGSTTASTALALLPFLGAGYTHLDGSEANAKYREVVERGLYYLSSRMIATPKGGDLQEGTMYAQGLATIVFCEAYAMTGDESLRTYAQSAINFLVSAQHAGGGWRYLPGQAGDTTSFGWQLMAVKSAQMAGLDVPSPTLHMASRFLDSVSADNGAHYGYQKPERGETTTSIGLLCRMYLGWPRSHKALSRGVDFLAKTGPSPTNLYYNYYATQVLHHYEGPHWERWNTRLRDHLVATQATQGHESGSWYFPDAKTKSAGRLYNTAMAVMTLEVYYRHLPLYTPQVLEAGE